MDRRRFLKICGLIPFAGSLATGERAVAKIDLTREMYANSINDMESDAEKRDVYYYGWIHCWMDDWDGVIICHSCSTKDCGIRGYATKVTNHPEHNIGDKLVVHCGWTFVYGKWTNQQPRCMKACKTKGGRLSFDAGDISPELKAHIGDGKYREGCRVLTTGEITITEKPTAIPKRARIFRYYGAS